MSELTRIWQRAAADLGIRVVAPYACRVGGLPHRFDVLVPDFGAPGGTVVVALGGANRDSRAAAAEFGVFLSELSLNAYGDYDRQLFIETLRDWGWFGPPESPPSWYLPQSRDTEPADAVPPE